MKLTPKKILWGLFIIFIVIYVIGITGHIIAEGHEFPNMKHVDNGKVIENVIASDWCYAGKTKQNKIVLYQDYNRDEEVDTCFTVWVEHGKLHAIMSEPQEDGSCMCEGYVWLDGDK